MASYKVDPVPDDVQSLRKRGKKFFDQSNYKKAIGIYDSALDILQEEEGDHCVTLARIFNNRALCYLQQEKLNECIEDCTMALQLLPHSVISLLRRSNAYEKSGQFDLAKEDIKELQALVAADCLREYQRYDYLIELRAQKLNKGILQPGVKISKDKVPIILQDEEGKSYDLYEDAPERPKIVKEPEIDKEQEYTLRKDKGAQHYQKGEYEDAVKCYKSCLELFSHRVPIYTNLAICFIRMDRPQDAVDACGKALEIDTLSIKALMRRSTANKMLKAYKNCVDDLELVLDLDQNNQEAQNELSQIKILQQNPPQSSGANMQPNAQRPGMPSQMPNMPTPRPNIPQQGIPTPRPNIPQQGMPTPRPNIPQQGMPTPRPNNPQGQNIPRPGPMPAQKPPSYSEASSSAQQSQYAGLSQDMGFDSRQGSSISTPSVSTMSGASFDASLISGSSAGSFNAPSGSNNQGKTVSDGKNASKIMTIGVLPLDIQNVIAKGDDHFHFERYDEASERYSKAIDLIINLYPDEKVHQSRIYFKRADVYKKQEDYQRAIVDCNQSLHLVPYNPEVLIFRAEVYEKRKRHESAYADYAELQELGKIGKLGKYSMKMVEFEHKQRRCKEALKDEYSFWWRDMLPDMDFPIDPEKIPVIVDASGNPEPQEDSQPSPKKAKTDTKGQPQPSTSKAPNQGQGQPKQSSSSDPYQHSSYGGMSQEGGSPTDYSRSQAKQTAARTPVPDSGPPNVEAPQDVGGTDIGHNEDYDTPGKIAILGTLPPAFQRVISDGDGLMNNKQYNEAAEKYTESINDIELYYPDEHVHLSRIYFKRANCYRYREQTSDDFRPCICDCDKSLEYLPHIPEVLIFRAKASEDWDRPEYAYADYLHLQEIGKINRLAQYESSIGDFEKGEERCIEALKKEYSFWWRDMVPDIDFIPLEPSRIPIILLKKEGTIKPPRDPADLIKPEDLPDWPEKRHQMYLDNVQNITDRFWETQNKPKPEVGSGVEPSHRSGFGFGMDDPFSMRSGKGPKRGHDVEWLECHKCPDDVEVLKTEGNNFVKAKNYEEAIQKYDIAIRKLDRLYEDVDVHKHRLHSNRALCYLRLEKYHDCIENCSFALEYQPHTVKPLLRRAEAYEGAELFSLAYLDYVHLQELGRIGQLAGAEKDMPSFIEGEARCIKKLKERHGDGFELLLPEAKFLPIEANEVPEVVETDKEVKRQPRINLFGYGFRKFDIDSSPLFRTGKAPRKPVEPEDLFALFPAGRGYGKTKKEVTDEEVDRFAFLEQMADQEYENGNFSAAAETYTECIRYFYEKDKKIKVYERRTRCYLELGEPDKALEDCNGLLVFDPFYEEGFLLRALTAKASKEYLRGISDLKSLLVIDETHEEGLKLMDELKELFREECPDKFDEEMEDMFREPMPEYYDEDDEITEVPEDPPIENHQAETSNQSNDNDNDNDNVNDNAEQGKNDNEPSETSQTSR